MNPGTWSPLSASVAMSNGRAGRNSSRTTPKPSPSIHSDPDISRKSARRGSTLSSYTRSVRPSGKLMSVVSPEAKR